MKALGALDLRLLHGLYDHGNAARGCVRCSNGALLNTTTRATGGWGFRSNGNSTSCRQFAQRAAANGKRGPGASCKIDDRLKL